MDKLLQKQRLSSKGETSDLKSFVTAMMIAPILKHKYLLVRGFTALLFLSLGQATMLFLVQPFLAAFFTDPAIPIIEWATLIPPRILPLFSGWPGGSIQKQDLAWGVPVAIVLAGVLNASASFWYNFSQEEISLRVANFYRETMFSQILRLPYLSSLKRNAGEWMSVIMTDSQFLQTRVAELLTGFVKDGVLILGGLIGLGLIHWPSAVALALLSPVIAWLMGRAGKRISFFAEAFQRELGNLAAALLDMRSRFRYMKAQHGEAFELQIFDDANQSYLQMMKSSIFIRALVTPIMEWVGFLILAGFLVAWHRGLMGEGFSPERAFQFFAALGIMLRPLRQMGEQVARWGETLGGLRRSMQVFESVKAEADLSQGSIDFKIATPKKQSRSLDGPFKQVSQIRMRPFIEVAEVVCKYDEQVTFSAKNLALPTGLAIAIIGPSGAGKSTFVRCLAGLIPPAVWTAGQGWREVVDHCVFVSQTPFLFYESLRRNLLYGLPEDLINLTTDEMLYGALKITGLDDFVRALPLGLETLFNPVAHNFSGGQIQRFVLGRALLRRKPILLLDEAMSAVDGATERNLTQVLVDTVHETGTVLVSVTHRLTWLGLYDEIWFVQNGSIIMKGSHESLLGSETYRQYVRAGTKA
ncbi:MAG: ABC transporter ATP-binding protein [Proteobacteria bacterium]|nr:ABC transporter ATP-binding protein [Pseudomonadota bacterium]